MEPTFFYGKKQRSHSDEPDQDENTENENETGDNDMSSEPYSDSPSHVPSDSEISCDDDISDYESSSSEDNNNLVDIWNPTTATPRSFSFTRNEHLAINLYLLKQMEWSLLMMSINCL